MMPKSSVFKRAAAHRHVALSADIAARSAIALLQELRCKTPPMDVAELRGYVRARALSVVRAGIQQAVADGRLPAAQSDNAIALTLERTAHLVTREIQLPPVIMISAPHVSARSAA